MTIDSAIKSMRAYEAKMSAFNHAMMLISYDGATTAPSGAGRVRGETLAALSEEMYKLSVAEEFRDAIYTVKNAGNQVDAQAAREAELLVRDYEQTSKVPMDEYVAFQQLVSDADDVWHRAKADNDFQAFQPYFERLVETMIRFAGYYAPEKDPYDVYLDQFEEGLTREIADSFFDKIKAELTPLIAAVNDAKQLDDSFFSLEYPIHMQRKLSDYLMQVLTLDRSHCAIGETEHPFTTNFSKWDVRITTHYYPTHPEYSMYSVIHEGGHALYELHTGDNLYRTRLAGGTSTAVHESQSRFFENMIGRSREFVRLIAPKLQELFPDQLKGIDAERLYRAANKSFPSLIRTEADELTYSMHVLIRYEIEKRLFSGDIKVAEVPGVWNEMYKQYLGIDVPDDRRGCLQDTHWSGGMFGYFPGYSLGSAYSAQIYERMGEDMDIPSVISSGNLTPIVDWLTEKIYRYGALLTPKQVIESACGAPFDASYYVNYLKNKFQDLYQL